MLRLKRTESISRITQWNGLPWTIAIFLVVSAGAALSWIYWEELRESQESLSTTIRNVSLIIGGTVAILLTIWRSVLATRQVDTSNLGLLDQRYQQGAEMLGSRVLSTRLGGVHALARLAKEHPEQYHIQIIELLCAFVRNPPEFIAPQEDTYYPYSLDSPRASEDVRAAIVAIGKRSQTALDIERQERYTLDLHGSNLNGANLSGANLESADLSKSTLVSANLCGANLVSCSLHDTSFQYSILFGSDMTHSHLTNSDLIYALAKLVNLSNTLLSLSNLSYADLESADLSGAQICGVDLSEANLTAADLSGSLFGTTDRTDHSKSLSPIREFCGLTQSQLDSAIADLEHPPRIVDGTVAIDTAEPLVWRS